VAVSEERLAGQQPDSEGRDEVRRVDDTRSGLHDAVTSAAAIAAAMKKPEPAARLLGAAHRIADVTGFRQHMIDAAGRSMTLADARSPTHLTRSAGESGWDQRARRADARAR
jgi:hypothetical protein